MDEYKQVVGDIDLSLLDGTNPYDLFLLDGAKQKFGPKLTNALEDARREGINQSEYAIVSRMLGQGMDWQVIEQLTGVDEVRYRELAPSAANGANGASD